MLDFPARLGPVAIADVQGDGTAQIVVVGSDGYVCCVKGSGNDKAQEK